MAMQQTQFFELYRAGLRTASDMTKASLENLERLQQQQLEALHNAVEASVKSSRELADVKSLDELMAVQTRNTGAQMERWLDFWGRVWRATADNQMTMIGQAQSQMGQVRERFRETYDFTTRTTEDAARVAASQWSSATDAAREAASQQERKQQERKTA